MEDERIDYELIRRRAAQRVRRRIWRSLLWHVIVFMLLSGVGVLLWADYYYYRLWMLWGLVVVGHFLFFIGNWIMDMVRDGEVWRELAEMHSRRERSMSPESRKEKREYVHLSDDGELAYYGEDDDSLYNRHGANAEREVG